MSGTQSEPQMVNTGDSTTTTPISQAILEGYAPGNELYTFTELPTISTEELVSLQEASYAEIFYRVTKKLLGSALPDEVLRATADEVYGLDNFDFDPEDENLRFTTLPSGIEIVGLSDGPTGAFKDMAMQPFARWMSYLQAQNNKPLSILLSTSGDTGPAALHAFGGLANTEVVAMLPKRGVSAFQWAQMAELSNPARGTHALEVEGSFSDINDMHMQADLVYTLGAVNSVNIARIIAQVPYHVASYLKAIDRNGGKIGDPVDMCVPSGNFGNALAAIIARKMGVPIRNIMVATNENNTLDTLFREHTFKLSEFQHTDSSAQDVRMPSNAWRYLAMLYSNDTAKIQQTYAELTASGSADIDAIGITDTSLIDNVYSVTVTAPERRATIQKIYSETNGRIVIDPHTANAVIGAEKLRKLTAGQPPAPIVAYETAKPFKFAALVEEIVGVAPARPERFAGLEERQAGKTLPQIADISELLDYLTANTSAQKK